MAESRDIIMVMERKEVDRFEPDLRGNNRKNRRKSGSVRDAPGPLAYGW